MPIRGTTVGVLLLIQFLAISAVAQQPVATLLTDPLEDRLLRSTDVSGGRLIGVLGTAVATPTAAEYLAVLANVRGSGTQVCLNIRSVDGRYQSGDVDYLLPRTSGLRRVRLPYEEKAREQDFLRLASAGEIAVLARVGPCPIRPDGQFLIATWRQPAVDVRRLTVAVSVMSGSKPSTVAWMLDNDVWSDAVACRRVDGRAVAFDKVCEMPEGIVPRLRRIRVSIRDPLAPADRGIPPIEFGLSPP